MLAYRVVTGLSLFTLLATDVRAQDLEIDLTDQPAVPAEFKPSIALLGVYASGEDAEGQAPRAKLIEEALQKAIEGSGSFGKIVDVATAQKAAPPVSIATCMSWACINTLAAKLDVHRVVVGIVERRGVGSFLTIYGYDSMLPEVLGVTVESGEREEKKQLGGFAGLTGSSAAQKDRDFVRKANNAAAPLLQKLATPLGKLVVDCFVASAITKLGEKPLGTGAFETYLPAGRHELTTTADDYKPFSAGITLEPQATATFKVSMVAKPLDHAVSLNDSAEYGQPIAFYKKPGTYVMAGGVAMVATGLVLGLMAKQTERTALASRQGNIVSIGRDDAKRAQTQALLSNVLVGAGGAVAAGGAVWFFLSPKYEAAPAVDAAPSDGAGFGFTIGAGGTF